MAKKHYEKKYYAVKVGRKTGIFTDWEKCKAQVEGYTGAVYKSFLDEESAKEFLTSDGGHKKYKNNFSGNTGLIAYTDGSYNESNHRTGYGVVILDKKGNELDTISGSLEADSRQIEGECFAALTAVLYAIRKGAPEVEIRYDYAGVEMWANGMWEANKKCSQEYRKAMCALRKSIRVTFKKVRAHSGESFNELADALAEMGCKC